MAKCSACGITGPTRSSFRKERRLQIGGRKDNRNRDGPLGRVDARPDREAVWRNARHVASPARPGRLSGRRDACRSEDARITEIAMGPWEGLTRDQIEKQYGEMLGMWHHRPDQVVFPEGETLADRRTQG